MSSDTDRLQLIESDCNFNPNPYLSKQSQYFNSLSTFSSLPNFIKPERSLYTMIKLLVENRNQLNIINSVLSMNAEDLDLSNKLNQYKELFNSLPFSFKYNKLQTKILLDLFQLEEIEKPITNLEINNFY